MHSDLKCHLRTRSAVTILARDASGAKNDALQASEPVYALSGIQGTASRTALDYGPAAAIRAVQ